MIRSEKKKSWTRTGRRTKERIKTKKGEMKREEINVAGRGQESHRKEKKGTQREEGKRLREERADRPKMLYNANKGLGGGKARKRQSRSKHAPRSGTPTKQEPDPSRLLQQV